MTSGILLIDKPPGWTSHDVVARTRRLAGTRKVGHAGTLDPMATGLLVLGIGTATRLLTHIVGLDKAYSATIRLGVATSTDDAEGEAIGRADAAAVAAVTEERLDRGIRSLTGDIEQVPSTVSAIKVDGTRAYARARAGEEVVLSPRRVRVASFESFGMRRVDGFVDVDVHVECSSGTYIRALARDLGTDLGVGGHLTALRRSRVGPFRILGAHDLETVDVATAVLSPADAATRVLARHELDAQETIDLGHGKRVAAPDGLPPAPVAAIGADGRLVAIVEQRGQTLRVVTGFPSEEPRQ